MEPVIAAFVNNPSRLRVGDTTPSENVAVISTVSLPERMLSGWLCDRVTFGGVLSTVNSMVSVAVSLPFKVASAGL